MKKIKLTDFLKPHWKMIAMLIILYLITIGTSIVIPRILGMVIDFLQKGTITSYLLIKDFIVVVILYALWDICSSIMSIQFQRLNKTLENGVREFCCNKVINAEVAVLQNKSDGEILNRVMRDTETLQKAFSNLFNLVVAIFHVTFLIIVMFTINIKLSLIISFLFLIIVLLQKFASNPLKELYRTYRNSEENIMVEFKNIISNFLVVKLFSLEESSLDILRSKNKKNLNGYLKINKRISIIKYLNFFIASIFKVIPIFMGGYFYIFHLITIGEIFAMYTYSIQLCTQLGMLIEADLVLKEVNIAFDRILKLIDEFEEDENKLLVDCKKIDKIRFENVTFGYGDKSLINNLTFEAKRNSIIGIVGGNGSGKTTLTYLICGFYNVDGVFIDDIPINDINKKELIKKISYVLQQSYLFPGTVMDNITLFSEKEKENACNICKKIGLHEKILKLPNGYDTIINEKNLNLSGGEKQLITIARALLKDSDVIILDEMNSSLDSKTEEKIIKNITQFFYGKIVFIISHREDVLNICDSKIKMG